MHGTRTTAARLTRTCIHIIPARHSGNPCHTLRPTGSTHPPQVRATRYTTLPAIPGPSAKRQNTTGTAVCIDKHKRSVLSVTPGHHIATPDQPLQLGLQFRLHPPRAVSHRLLIGKTLIGKLLHAFGQDWRVRSFYSAVRHSPLRNRQPNPTGATKKRVTRSPENVFKTDPIFVGPKHSSGALGLNDATVGDQDRFNSLTDRSVHLRLV